MASTEELSKVQLEEWVMNDEAGNEAGGALLCSNMQRCGEMDTTTSDALPDIR